VRQAAQCLWGTNKRFSLLASPLPSGRFDKHAEKFYLYDVNPVFVLRDRIYHLPYPRSTHDNSKESLTPWKR